MTTHRYDGTKESATAAQARTDHLENEALGLITRAKQALIAASAVCVAEEYRHKVMDIGWQRQSGVWTDMASMLDNIAGALGGGNPNRSVFWNGEAFEIEEDEEIESEADALERVPDADGSYNGFRTAAEAAEADEADRAHFEPGGMKILDVRLAEIRGA